MIRYYYADRVNKIAYVSTTPQFTDLDYIGVTDNPHTLMAVGAFLRGEEGYRIVESDVPE